MQLRWSTANKRGHENCQPVGEIYHTTTTTLGIIAQRHTYITQGCVQKCVHICSLLLHMGTYMLVQQADRLLAHSLNYLYNLFAIISIERLFTAVFVCVGVCGVVMLLDCKLVVVWP